MSENIGKIGWIDMTVMLAAACVANGGELLVEPRDLAGGATSALYQP